MFPLYSCPVGILLALQLAFCKQTKTKQVKMVGNLEAATILVEHSKVFENIGSKIGTKGALVQYRQVKINLTFEAFSELLPKLELLKDWIPKQHPTEKNNITTLMN